MQWTVPQPLLQTQISPYILGKRGGGKKKKKTALGASLHGAQPPTEPASPSSQPVTRSALRTHPRGANRAARQPPPYSCQRKLSNFGVDFKQVQKGVRLRQPPVLVAFKCEVKADLRTSPRRAGAGVRTHLVVERRL